MTRFEAVDHAAGKSLKIDLGPVRTPSRVNSSIVCDWEEKLGGHLYSGVTGRGDVGELPSSFERVSR